MFRNFKIAAAGLMAVVVGMSTGVSRAQSPVQSGNIYDGWQITVPAGIALAVDPGPSNTLILEKVADFDSTTGLLINFLQTSTSAAPTVEIANEMITNSSNTTWGGFAFELLQPIGTGVGFAGTAGNVFAPPVGYSSYNVVSSNLIDYTGSQPAAPAVGDTSSWGAGADDGHLIINADPSSNSSMFQDFAFKEQPVTGTSIPLPAAAWESLVGILGLALMGAVKNRSKLLA